MGGEGSFESKFDCRLALEENFHTFDEFDLFDCYFGSRYIKHKSICGNNVVLSCKTKQPVPNFKE